MLRVRFWAFLNLKSHWNGHDLWIRAIRLVDSRCSYYQKMICSTYLVSRRVLHSWKSSRSLASRWSHPADGHFSDDTQLIIAFTGEYCSYTHNEVSEIRIPIDKIYMAFEVLIDEENKRPQLHVNDAIFWSGASPQFRTQHAPKKVITSPPAHMPHIPGPSDNTIQGSMLIYWHYNKTKISLFTIVMHFCILHWNCVLYYRYS